MAQQPLRSQPPGRPGADSRLPAADAATVAKIREAISDRLDQPETEPKCRYVLLSQPRTGGTFLAEALQRSGVAGVPFEYLNPASLVALQKRFGLTSRTTLSQAMAELQRHRTTPNGMFGLHLHFEQITKILGSVDSAWRWLGNFDRLIFLYRRDKLAQAVSLFRSIESRVWFQEAHEKGERLPERWSFDALAVARHVAALSEQEAMLRRGLASLSIPWIEITYEEIDKDFRPVWEKVGTFLGLPPVPVESVQPQLKRMRDGASAAMIEKFLLALRDSDLVRDAAFRTIEGRRGDR